MARRVTRTHNKDGSTTIRTTYTHKNNFGDEKDRNVC